MSRDLTVVVLVEGQTEHGFVKEVLAPYWGQRGIFVQAPIYRTQVDMRSGRVHKGGDIRFARFAKQLVALSVRIPSSPVLWTSMASANGRGWSRWPKARRLPRWRRPYARRQRWLWRRYVQASVLDDDTFLLSLSMNLRRCCSVMLRFFPPCFMFRRVPLRRCWKKVAVPRP